MPNMKPAYMHEGLVLKKGMESAEVKELQRDLRQLGYLRAGIDGDFGGGTEAAVKALQIDLIKNDGTDKYGGTPAPVAVKAFNVANLSATDGVMTQPLAQCLVKMRDSDDFPKLPFSPQPQTENAKILPIVQQIQAMKVPLPFLVAILEQESNIQHYRVPTPGNEDNFVLVGLDRGDKTSPDRVTSRGYGVGQYTFFHHPLTQHEIDTYVRDIEKNIHFAIEELLAKFNGFVVGPSDTADDHAHEHKPEHTAKKLRICQHPDGHPLRMKACKECMEQVAKCTINANQTHWFPGSAKTYFPTDCHKVTQYRNVPIRADVPCDWPYAVRRYNGSGINSFHYQTKILLRVLSGPPSEGFLVAHTTHA